MKLWVDDFRDAPDASWVEVRKVQGAIRLIATQKIEEISLDHDIENRPDDETFQPVAYFIGANFVDRPDSQVPKVRIHSDNPVGARELQFILKGYGIEAPWEPYTREADFKKKFGLD